MKNYVTPVINRIQKGILSNDPSNKDGDFQNLLKPVVLRYDPTFRAGSRVPLASQAAEAAEVFNQSLRIGWYYT
ncbi:MAG: hypothetical protein M1282_07880 [Chloroflexi bacterium]|nr:hypothetical protein [Chloroflexota bacterium]